jgi:hypothetical protein
MLVGLSHFWQEKVALTNSSHGSRYHMICRQLRVPQWYTCVSMLRSSYRSHCVAHRVLVSGVR